MEKERKNNNNGTVVDRMAYLFIVLKKKENKMKLKKEWKRQEK